MRKQRNGSAFQSMRVPPQFAVVVPEPEQIVKEDVSGRSQPAIFNQATFFISLQQMPPLAKPRLETDQRKAPRVGDQVFVDVPAELKTCVRKNRFVPIASVVTATHPTALSATLAIP